MQYFRISKYNPTYRNKEGIYTLKDEWAEFFMVKDNLKLQKNYYKIEQIYVDFLIEILNLTKKEYINCKWFILWEESVDNFTDLLYLENFFKNCFIGYKEKTYWINIDWILKTYTWIKVANLSYKRFYEEKYWIYTLNDVIYIPKAYFWDFIKLILRWFAGIYFLFGNKIKIKFWYDFYVYLQINNWVVNDKIIEKYAKKL